MSDPPHNLEIEQSLLGDMLADNASYDRVSDFLQARHFFEPAHGKIYDVIGKLIDRGEIASVMRLSGHFDNDDALKEIGGSEYLRGLADCAIPHNARQHAAYLFELWQRRGLIGLAQELEDYSATNDPNQSAAEIIRAFESDLYEITRAGPEQTARRMSDIAFSAGEQIKDAYLASQRGEIVGVSSGLDTMDRKIGGFRAGSLYVLAGATAMGKSALAGTIADNAARAGKTVLFASLEMSAEQQVKRSIAGITKIAVDHLERGTLDSATSGFAIKAAGQVAKWPIVYDDRGDMTVADLRGMLRRALLAGPVDLVIVDYLQLLRPTAGDKYESRASEIGKITRALKATAMEMNVPVLALSQLSRQIEARENKRPQLSDLRESGSIEQDADVVLFVYREDYYLERSKPPDNAAEDKKANWETRKLNAAGKAELIIAKQRQGATGKAMLNFNPKTTRFSDIQTHELANDMEELL